MRVIFLGSPGAGKGTQAAVLKDRYGLAHISTGDILRENVRSGTALGKAAKGYMDSGGLVPDDVIIAMMRERLQEPDCRGGFILDGFPRTVPQAEALDRLLEEMGINLDGVILFEVPRQLVIDRLTGRRVCGSCGEIYNVRFKNTATPGVCDRCGGELTQRDDDREEVVIRRLEVYEEQTAPLIRYYEEQGRLIRVDAGQEGGRVVAAIEKAVGL
ncbi:MAG TPA: adenylate kinase [Synergistales bacterium]|nr:adenylate kinase [Synergistales bacterium]